MKWITHVVSTLCLTIALAKFIPITYAGLILAIVSSILPDWIESSANIKHRSKFVHNFLIPAILSPFIVHPTLAGFVIGYSDHLLIDATTKHGVYFGDKRIKGSLNTQNPSHNALIIFIHCLTLFASIIF